MKFKKDGLTFSDIIQARDIICGYRNEDGKPYCSICPTAYPEHCKLTQYYKQKHINIDNCYGFCVNNPRIAAEIMGFEVIDDEPQDTTQESPLDIGSMTLNQAKEYCFKWRHSHDAPCEESGCELRRRHVCLDWVHEWDFCRLTPQELEICMAVGAKWVTRGMSDNTVDLWRERPIEGQRRDSENHIGILKCSVFQSVKPGDCICVDDCTTGGENSV